MHDVLFVVVPGLPDEMDSAQRRLAGVRRTIRCLPASGLFSSSRENLFLVAFSFLFADPLPISKPGYSVPYWYQAAGRRKIAEA
jgi:hypothetical protein